MNPYLLFIIGVIFCVILALAVGQFLGTSNKRCYYELNWQGRKRLDDCDFEQCHQKGDCRFNPNSLPKE